MKDAELFNVCNILTKWIILFSLLSASDRNDAKYTIFLSVIAHFSLLPLLFTPEMFIIKISLYLTYISFTIYCINHFHPNWYNLLSKWHIYYLGGLVLVYLYETVLQYLFSLNEKYTFLPLLLTSVYCSIGCNWFWAAYYFDFLGSSDTSKTQSTINPIKLTKKKKNK